jgi:hypothetical protein
VLKLGVKLDVKIFGGSLKSIVDAWLGSASSSVDRYWGIAAGASS